MILTIDTPDKQLLVVVEPDGSTTVFSGLIWDEYGDARDMTYDELEAAGETHAEQIATVHETRLAEIRHDNQADDAAERHTRRQEREE